MKFTAVERTETSLFGTKVTFDFESKFHKKKFKETEV
jgi:hypothetical protein